MQPKKKTGGSEYQDAESPRKEQQTRPGQTEKNQSCSPQPSASFRGGKYSISKSYSYEEIRWGAVMDSLAQHHKWDPIRSHRIIQKFLNRLESPMEVYWFQVGKLSKNENQIITALCSLYKTGLITITREQRYYFGFFQMQYLSKIRFAPDWSAFQEQEPGGSCFPEIQFKVFGKSMHLTSANQVGLLRLVIITMGSLFYAFFVGGVLYILSVIIVFHRYPMATVQEAISNPPLGVALVGGFVVLGMVFTKVLQVGIAWVTHVMRKDRAD